MLEFWPPGLFPQMRTVLPEFEKGDLRLVHRTVTKSDSDMSCLTMMNQGRGYVREGDCYATLYERGTLWMSDTSDERRDHREAVRQATGECLVGGLGLGLVALAMALKPEVTRVDVVEINSELIKAILPHLQKHDQGKINIIEADLMEWKPPKGKAWDVLWFDIWPHLCTDDLEDHSKLNRRYGRRTRQWRGCWGHELLKYRQRQEKKQERYWRW